MKKFLKILLWSLLGIMVILFGAGSLFLYKVKYGFPVLYETAIPEIDFPENKTRVLLFSKSTGFRHGESIEAGKKVFEELATQNNWFLYATESGGVFNAEQLPKFDVVVFNNSTGRVLNDEQQKILETYVEQGGKLVGIHGSGDDSHRWDWYEQNFLGAKFSHHAISAQLQMAGLTLNENADSVLRRDLPGSWKQADEWYVFYENPETRNFHILYWADGDSIDPNGNILWIKDKNFGMGKAHPVSWYRSTGKGWTFYTSLGHDAGAWQQKPFVKMLENAINYPVQPQ